MTSKAPVVPFVDLSRQFKAHEKEYVDIFRRVGRSGIYILGDEVFEFEREVAAFCDVRHAIAVANGTDALSLALCAVGIRPGDEVITVPNSFIASAGAIAAAGGNIRFVDVLDDLNMDPAKLRDSIGPKTKAIMPVHLTGRPADMDPIMAAARQHGLKVIEDAAQALGARYKGKPAGGLGDIACFSLHPLKNLNVFGDGGLVTTSDDALAAKVRSRRNHGLVDRNVCAEWGVNSRLDNLQAAIARIKLAHLKDYNQKFVAIAERYREGLADVVTVPRDKPSEYCVYHNFVIYADRRDALQKFLAEAGVETKIHYPILLHLQPAAKALGYKRGDFPVAECLVERMLSLPIYPELTFDEVGLVIESIQRFYR